MIEKYPIIGMSREDWLDERRHSIGGSEIGAILGVNKYASPVSVWANKSGLVPDAEPNEAMRQGTDLEEYVARRFTELSGKKIRRCNYIMRNTDFPHIHANVDRLIVGERAGLECKTSSALGGSRFKESEFPTSYYAQCVSYMAVTELPVWYLAVLVLGKEFKVYALSRDENTVKPEWCESITYVSSDDVDAIRTVAADFWQHVEDGTMPDTDGSNATSEALGKMFAASESEEDADLNRLSGTMRKLLDLRDQQEEIKAEIEACKNAIKAEMGTAIRADCGIRSVTWKAQTRSTGLDKKAFRKDHPEIDLEKYSKTSATRVFKILED